MNKQILEESVSSRKKLYNDSEFKDVVKTFYEIVSQINKSFKKQKRKKHHHQPTQVQQTQTKKKEEVKQFKRNSYHVQIAYRLYIRNQAQNHTDELDPTYPSKKMRKNNTLMEQENHQNNGNAHVLSIETTEQR